MLENVHWLRSPRLHAAIDMTTGALAALHRPGGWPILDRPRLGRSFEILLPLPDRRHNTANGDKQPSPIVEIFEDGTSVAATWQGVRSEHGGEHDITVRTVVSVTSGRLVFAVDIENHSSQIVENVCFPCLGDVRPPSRDSHMEAFTWMTGGARRSRIWPAFDNHAGYWGVDHPTLIYGCEEGAAGAPVAPFVLLQNGREGLYLGVDEPSSELVSWFGELVPGWSESMEALVPSGDTVAGRDVAIRIAAAHVPYVLPGERRALTPIMMDAFDGDWHAGADIYIERRSSWSMPSAVAPSWAREPHSWLQIQVNSPEDELRWTFDQLPAIAEECREKGVSVIQLVGWNDGGQDQNNPSHDADARLGGPLMLADAIEACHELGVRVVLFTKFTWADRASERFRSELVREAVKDPHGDYYCNEGYRYQTVTQLLDINTKRLIPMCFGDARYLEVCREEFAKVLRLGADGMLFDEAFEHTPALLCFAKDHTHRYADPVYSHDREFVEALRERSDSLAPQFLFAGETLYDWELESYQLSYIRSADPAHIPVSRYLRPDVTMMTALTGFDDRSMVNHCLLYRYVISYEPFNFKGRLPDMPQTVEYGMQMDQLRAELRAWVWDATFQDTVGAQVQTDDGIDHHPYTVFRRPDGCVAVVVANYAQHREKTVVVHVVDGPEPRRYRLVDDSSWRDVRDGILIPPRSAAVVLPDCSG